jgi:hypothetical protein
VPEVLEGSGEERCFDKLSNRGREKTRREKMERKKRKRRPMPEGVEGGGPKRENEKSEEKTDA